MVKIGGRPLPQSSAGKIVGGQAPQDSSLTSYGQLVKWLYIKI